LPKTTFDDFSIPGLETKERRMPMHFLNRVFSLNRKPFVHCHKVLPAESRPSASAIMHGVSKEDLGIVQIVSSDNYIKRMLGSILCAQSFEVCFTQDLDNLARGRILIIDIDGLGGILNVIDELIAFRVANPAVITVLMSEDFQRDEFEGSRLWVCDASLRLPFSFSRLEQALIEADLNTLVWQGRCQDGACGPWVPNVKPGPKRTTTSPTTARSSRPKTRPAAAGTAPDT
jgi:hypothetical protein